MGKSGRWVMRVLLALLAAATGLNPSTPAVYADDDDWEMELPEPGPETPLSEEEQEAALAVIREALTAREQRVTSFDVRFTERLRARPQRVLKELTLPLTDDLTELPAHESRLIVAGSQFRSQFASASPNASAALLTSDISKNIAHQVRSLTLDAGGATPIGIESIKPDRTWRHSPFRPFEINLRFSQSVALELFPPIDFASYTVAEGECNSSPCYVLHQRIRPGGLPNYWKLWFDLSDFVAQRIERRKVVDGHTDQVSVVMHAWYGSQVNDGAPDRWRYVRYFADQVELDGRQLLESFEANPVLDDEAFNITFPPGTQVTVWPGGGADGELYVVQPDGSRTRQTAAAKPIPTGAGWRTASLGTLALILGAAVCAAIYVLRRRRGFSNG